MKLVLYRLVVPLAALIGGTAAFLSIFVLGLAVPGLVILPLTLLGAALFAGLGAAWTSNFIAPDSTRSRLPGVLLFSLISTVLAGLATLIVNLVLAAVGMYAIVFGAVLFYGTAAVVLAGGTSLAVFRLRGPRGRLGIYGAAALLLSGLWTVATVLLSPGGYLVSGVQDGIFQSRSESEVYGTAAAVGLALAALGIFGTVRGFREASGRASLGRDAALTLALVGLYPPVAIGAVYAVCDTGRCIA